MAKEKSPVGEYAFFAGVILAIIIGLFQLANWWMLVLAVLGLIVGFINITEKETTAFLVAAVALLIAGTANLGSIPPEALGNAITGVLDAVGAFVAPAAIIVGLKAVWGLAKK